MNGRLRESDFSHGIGHSGLLAAGRDGINGMGIGPLTLVEGAKKLFQDVS